MIKSVESKFDYGQHVKYRSFCDRPSGTGYVVGIDLKQYKGNYYFIYLIEFDSNRERHWLEENELKESR